MKEILAICSLRFKLMFRDKILTASLLLLPLLFMLILGSVSGFDRVPQVPVAVADLDQSDYSRVVIQRFAAKEGIRIIETDPAGARQLVGDYKVEAGFVIQQGFQVGVINGSPGLVTVIKSPNSLAYGMLQETFGGEVARLASNSAAASRVTNAFKTYNLHMAQSSADLWASVWSYTDALWDPEPLLKLEYTELSTAVAPVKVVAIPVSASVAIGVLTMFMMLLVMFNSGWLIEERDNGTLQRILLVPNLLRKYFAGNILSLFILASCQIALAALAAKLLYGGMLLGSLSQVLVEGAYILACIGFSLLCSAFFTTQERLQTAAPMIALLSGAVGGCFWSFIDLPSKLHNLALLTPQGWTLDALLGLMRDSYTLDQTLLSLAVLLAFAAVSGVASYLVLRRKLG